jgi:phosphate transport system protein
VTFQHIVKSYDEDLRYLHDQILSMGQLVIDQLEKSITCVVRLDKELANSVIQNDLQVDRLEHDLEAFAVRMIALRQPVASDLRHVIAALKISSHLERIADYGANTARRGLSLAAVGVPIVGASGLPRMSAVAQSMLHDILHAYAARDDAQAIAVWQRDVELDEMYMSYLREILTYMMEDQRNISSCTQLLFIAKNIERMGDHVTNIAAMVHYLISGSLFDKPRPKGMHTTAGKEIP